MPPLSLVANAGSATTKYSLFDGTKNVATALYQQEGKTFSLVMNGKHFPLSKREFRHSMKAFLAHPSIQAMTRNRTIGAIGFRYVHGGTFFKRPTKVTAAVLKRLKELDGLAPLHNPVARKLVLQTRKLLPTAKMVLVFDTGFHATLPELNWRYALPRELADLFDLRRYGFHGVACASIVRQLQRTRRLARRTVICHLGSGCSVTAALDGKSVATSMGMTPLEGVMMGTRAGDVDPGVLLHLLLTHKVRLKKLDSILQHESGLLGLAGTNDMRVLLKRKDKRSRLAVEMFCKRVAEYVMRYAVDLGGVDLVVFSGGIGTNSSTVRQNVMRYLKPLGVVKSMRMKADEAAEIFEQIRNWR